MPPKKQPTLSDTSHLIDRLRLAVGLISIIGINTGSGKSSLSKALAAFFASASVQVRTLHIETGERRGEFPTPTCSSMSTARARPPVWSAAPPGSSTRSGEPSARRSAAKVWAWSIAEPAPRISCCTRPPWRASTI